MPRPDSRQSPQDEARAGEQATQPLAGGTRVIRKEKEDRGFIALGELKDEFKGYADLMNLSLTDAAKEAARIWIRIFGEPEISKPHGNPPRYILSETGALLEVVAKNRGRSIGEIVRIGVSMIVALLREKPDSITLDAINAATRQPGAPRSFSQEVLARLRLASHLLELVPAQKRNEWLTTLDPKTGEDLKSELKRLK